VDESCLVARTSPGTLGRKDVHMFCSSRKRHTSASPSLHACTACCTACQHVECWHDLLTPAPRWAVADNALGVCRQAGLPAQMSKWQEGFHHRRGSLNGSLRAQLSPRLPRGTASTPTLPRPGPPNLHILTLGGHATRAGGGLRKALASRIVMTLGVTWGLRLAIGLGSCL
jgi:hypothetical protein